MVGLVALTKSEIGKCMWRNSFGGFQSQNFLDVKLLTSFFTQLVTSTTSTIKMRGKRSKQYRKLMNQYGLAFNFREPYQVLVDADIVRDTSRMKMDLEGGLKRTLHGLVKPSTLSTLIKPTVSCGS
jgi:hypothetical protein